MSEATQPAADTAAAPQPAPSISDKIKAAVPTIPALVMSAGAGVAGGGMLSDQLSNVIDDLSAAAHIAWLLHPQSWAGCLIFLGGLFFHMRKQPS